MNLIKITDVVSGLNISSRSLRYYEQVGLIQSVRMPFEKYRYYNSENIERLKQIMVLRKMLIPIKDIIRVYESETMDAVVETFVNRIQAIDDEVNALTELRAIVNEFLQTMLRKGVTKISALPILYEKMEKQLEVMENKPISYENLSALSERLAAPVQPAIIELPRMRVLSSRLKENVNVSDTNGFFRWVQANNIPQGAPGCHSQFEYQSGAEDVFILQIHENFSNTGPYLDFIFDGGLFALAQVYLDEDLGERFRSLVSSFDENKYYEVDYNRDGSLRHEAMVENLISPDDKRALVALIIPVKKRLANPALFHQPKEISADAITIKEIENANPILWEENVDLSKLIPINNPHYKILQTGEVEYTGWISTRVLSANVNVKLPFRVDIEFRVGDKKFFSNGSAEGSIRMYHGSHGKDHNYIFGVNMNNSPDPQLSQEALCFHQPIFRDYFYYPKRGKIKPGYNKLTWIVGEKHFACIINEEIRYCGTNFPYMNLDLTREIAKPIIIGSDGQGMKYFRSIRVSQLAVSPKNKIKEGALNMLTKQSNNIISTIRRVVTDEYGENYWFNGCAAYVMECLKRNEFDYIFFAGINGDVFTQFYPHSRNYNGDAVSSVKIDDGGTAFVESLFEKCGYASTYVLGRDLNKNKEMYRQTLISYIDNNVPVITWCQGTPALFGVIVGYEEFGKTLLYIMGNKNEPERVSFEDAIKNDPENSSANGECGGWVFVGEKIKNADIAQVYRNAIFTLPALLETQTDTFSFGAEAFRAWANTIESGWFENILPENFDSWGMYSNFVCVLATNGSCCHEFLKRAREFNPDMIFLDDVSKLYKKTADMWNNQQGEDLEALGGGFNVTLEALQNKEKRGKIVNKLNEFAATIDEIVNLLKTGLRALK
jgi:DNA-binding transcriptional MerR regulator